MQDEDRWIDDKEASRITGYRRSTLQALRCRGGGPPFTKRGSGKRGLVRYRYIDIVRWMEQNPRVRHTGEYPEPRPDDEFPGEGITYGRAPLVAEQVMHTLGLDFLAGFDARRKGRKLNLEQSGHWQEGWKACDRARNEYDRAHNRIRLKERA